ncbi:MAG: response regulator [Candidatus Aminicenantes bacterium]|nr:response regulator [Candidatus Aminicenantes bacterium]
MKKRILIVEDDITMRRAIGLVLYEAGIEISEAKNGEEAVNLIEDKNYDLVITDLFLDTLSGFDLYSKYKNEVSFIIITGRPESELGQRSKKVLGNNFLEKPFTSEQLIEKTNLILHK